MRLFMWLRFLKALAAEQLIRLIDGSVYISYQEKKSVYLRKNQLQIMGHRKDRMNTEEKKEVNQAIEIFVEGSTAITSTDPVTKSKALAVRAALKTMFKSGRFSICTIDSCLKVSGAIPNGDMYDILRTLHCVHYKDMDQETQRWVFEATLSMFDNNGFDLSRLDSVLSEHPDVKNESFLREMGVS